MKSIVIASALNSKLHSKIFMWLCKVIIEVALCMCVFIFSHREDFFRLKDVQGILEGADQRSCVVNVSWVLYAKFHHLRIWKCHILPPKTKTPAEPLLERKQYDIMCSTKMIYIDVGYKSALVKPTSDEKILKIRRLL